jgi:hypothetical protein
MLKNKKAPPAGFSELFKSSLEPLAYGQKTCQYATT